jgi:hypothetical protein
MRYYSILYAGYQLPNDYWIHEDSNTFFPQPALPHFIRNTGDATTLRTESEKN